MGRNKKRERVWKPMIFADPGKDCERGSRAVALSLLAGALRDPRPLAAVV